MSKNVQTNSMIFKHFTLKAFQKLTYLLLKKYIPFFILLVNENLLFSSVFLTLKDANISHKPKIINSSEQFVIQYDICFVNE